MLRELVNLADYLDAKGMRKQADYLDIMIKKYATVEITEAIAIDKIASIKNSLREIDDFYKGYFSAKEGGEAQLPMSRNGNLMIPNTMYFWYNEPCVGEVNSDTEKGKIGNSLLRCLKSLYKDDAITFISDMDTIAVYGPQEIMRRDSSEGEVGKITTWPENNPLLDRPIEGRSGTYQFFSTYKAQMKRLIELAEAELRLAKD